MMKPFIALSLLLFLTACGRDSLYSGLTEDHANGMIVALHDAGIDATKEPGKDGTWSVTAGRQHFADAVSVLRAKGFPREQHATMGDLFKKKGIVATPLEERARFIHGLTEELSTTLSAIDGVLVARVHIVSPEIKPLVPEPMPPSASVFIKHAADADLSSSLGSMKALVANAVEGLDYERVSIALFEAEAAPQPQIREVQRLPRSAAALGAGGLVASLLGGFAIHSGRRRTLRKTATIEPAHRPVIEERANDD